MTDFTTTFLLGEGIDQNKLLKCVDEISEKAIKEVEKGNHNAMFIVNGMHITIAKSNEIPDINTEDEYVLIIQEA